MSKQIYKSFKLGNFKFVFCKLGKNKLTIRLSYERGW